MKIIENSIIDVSPTFLFTEALLQGMNYQFWTRVIAFSFEGEPNCNKRDLEQLVSLVSYGTAIENPEDALIEVSWEDAQKFISKHLRYVGHPDVADEGGFDDPGEEFRIASYEAWEKRKKIFWRLFSHCIAVPPVKCYQRVPGINGYLGDFMVWGISFVFLNDSQGLLIEAGATD